MSFCQVRTKMQEENNRTEDTSLKNYNGFWFRQWVIDGIISYQNHFQAHNSDIYLATLPKSGTTWIKALMFSLLNRDKYKEAKNDHPLLAKNPHELVPFLEKDSYNKEKVLNMSSFSASPRLFGTHIPFQLLPLTIKHSSCKVVYLCRDPKDTFISHWHFLNKFMSLFGEDQVSIEDEFEQYSSGVYTSGPFWDHMLGYWKESVENPERVLFMKFEEVKKEPENQLRRLAEFLGCPITEDEESSNLIQEILELCSIGNLRSLEVNNKPGWLHGLNNEHFFRRGEVGDWKNYLTPEMSDRLDKICQEKLSGFGLSF